MKGDFAFPLIPAPGGHGERDMKIDPNQKRGGNQRPVFILENLISAR
jgi:hypothetical protein